MWLLFALPLPALNQLCRHSHRRIALFGGKEEERHQATGEFVGSCRVAAPSEPETDTDGSQHGAFKQACAEPCRRAWAGRSSPGSSIRLQLAPLPGWARPPNSRIPPTSKVKLLFSQVPGWLDSKALAAKAENVALLWRIQMWLRFQEFGPSVTGIW